MQLQPTLLATYNQTYLPSPCILSQPQLIIRFINLGRESTSLSVRKKHKKHKKHKCGRLCATIATIAGVLAAVIAAMVTTLVLTQTRGESPAFDFDNCFSKVT